MVEDDLIVVRTSNKKYYKRIEIPDMQRLGLKLDGASLTWKHQHNTLIISYSKPKQVLVAEAKHLEEALKAAVSL
jgi:hypothetical protein